MDDQQPGTRKARVEVTREMAVRLAYVYYAERMQFGGWNELGEERRERLIERARVDLLYVVGGDSSALDKDPRREPDHPQT